jgi:hypothetical protein
MEQKLQLNQVIKPFKKGEKIMILELTDFQLHMNGKPPKSVGKLIERSIDNKKPGRIFGPLNRLSKKSEQDKNTMKFQLPIDIDDSSLKEAVRKYQKQGYRVMIQKPKDSIPVKLGKDVEEFMNSKNGKRIIRGLAKNKKQE